MKIHIRVLLPLLAGLALVSQLHGEPPLWSESCQAVLKEARREWRSGFPDEFEKYYELVDALGKSVDAMEAKRLEAMEKGTLEECIALAAWDVHRNPLPLKLLRGWLGKQEYYVTDDYLKLLHAEMLARGYGEEDLPHPVRSPVPIRTPRLVKDTPTQNLLFFAERDFRAAWEIYSLHYLSAGSVGYLDRIGGEKSLPVCLEALARLREQAVPAVNHRRLDALSELILYFRSIRGETALTTELTCVEIAMGVYEGAGREFFRTHLLLVYCQPDPALKVQHWVRIRPSLLALLKRTDLDPDLRKDLEMLQAALPEEGADPKESKSAR